MSEIIIVEPLRDEDGKAQHNSLGPLYVVRHRDEVLLERTNYPMGDAARELRKRGYYGTLEMRSAMSSVTRMTGDIERAAGLTVTESGGRCRFKKYTPVDYKKFDRFERQKQTQYIAEDDTE